MRFRNKILLAISSVVLVLLIITSVIINYWTRVQVETRFTDDLRRNATTLRELSALKSEEIMKTCEILAATPRLKAVVELGDPNTALQLSRELNQSIVGDLFSLSDARGKTLVWLIDNAAPPARAGAQPPVPALGTVGRPGALLSVVDGGLYRCASVPVIVGTDLLGTLTLGFRIEAGDLEAIKTMTNSDVVLALGEKIVHSTLTPGAEAAFATWADEHRNDRPADSASAVLTAATSLETYLATSVPLGPPGTPAARFVLLKPVEREVEAALKPVFSTFMVLSVIVLLVTAGIGFLISQGITRPIAALVRGTTEISRGNYDYAIAVGKDAELRYLAEKFIEMSRSLKEKMRELAERNEKLEEALRQLNAAQMELVKSERLAATGKLTAQLAHEINNPVHNIQSCLQTILKRTQSSAADAASRELIGVALEEVTRLARLTHQMLDVYRSSLLPLERVEVSLNEVIREVATSSQAAFVRQRIELRLLLDPSLPPVEGSKDKLKQVFLNLFLNAGDAMPEGGTLAVQTAKHNGTAVVDVTDTGVGIPPENVNRIFDAFFTTKHNVSGVGLGLAVTYGIVRQHDGTITVRSRTGEGTTFQMTFPIKAA